MHIFRRYKASTSPRTIKGGTSHDEKVSLGNAVAQHQAPKITDSVGNALAIRAVRDAGEIANNVAWKGIAGIAILVIDAVQNAKSNREECETIRNQICDFIHVIINRRSGNENTLTLDERLSLEHLQHTLMDVIKVVKKLGDRTALSRVFLSTTDRKTLIECQDELQQAAAVFNVASSVQIIKAIQRSNTLREEQHEELLKTLHSKKSLELEALRIYAENREEVLGISPLEGTLKSFLPPPKPAVFFGRSGVVEQLSTQLYSSNAGRYALLGPGGIGKSSVAAAIFHANEVESKFGSRRFFIKCDAATSKPGVISVMASYLRILIPSEKKDPNSRQAQQQIVEFLKEGGLPTLLILDNWESPWEPHDSRLEVEGFLATLASLENLSILITMRGNERPSGTRWTRPFLPPLEPLSRQASKDTFLAISDISEDDRNLDKIIDYTEDLPLALVLMATVASYEGSENVVARWETEGAALLKRGTSDRQSSLESSLRVSLTSPRFTANTHALGLLTVLCLFPDGTTMETLRGAIPSLKTLSSSLTILRQTALASPDQSGRIRVLAPIRSYILSNYTIPEPLFDDFHRYLGSLKTFVHNVGTEGHTNEIAQFTPELGNFTALVGYFLHHDPHPAAAIEGALALALLHRNSSLGSVTHLPLAEETAEEHGEYSLQAECIWMMAVIAFERDLSSAPPYKRVEESLELYQKMNNISGQASCHAFFGTTSVHQNKIGDAISSLTIAQNLYLEAQDVEGQARNLLNLTHAYRRQGDLRKATELCLKASHLFGTLRKRFAQGACLESLGEILYMRGAYAHAITICNSGMAVMQRMGYTHDVSFWQAHCLSTIADAALRTSRLPEAKKGYQEVLKYYDRHSRLDRAANCVVQLGEVSLEEGDTDAARKFYQRGLEMWTAPNRYNTWGHGTAVLGVAKVSHREGDISASWSLYKEAMALFVKADFAPFVAECRYGMGDILLHHQPDFPSIDEATASYVLGFLLYRKSDEIYGQAVGMRRLGDLALVTGALRDAEARYEAALEVLTTSGVVRDVADCWRGLGDVSDARGSSGESAARMRWERALELYKLGRDTRGILSIEERLSALDSA
ncbi:hypothetical protein SISSUDRAFT_1066985 [Sistotremastrum suecicum HHB10207 ss-3]|uniref:Novel STAND NTPase 1 domain-containing protein n=1 Tax=Sistotremastrum suecicum HHB10207 ss-3 TaxID=1314776 RepID=A0A165XN82_9AGAM|nr:hypothetical protein SISSUDRAFT_1066985 [Sistotremastrum suecicum HHB10207 ss-3]